jgi:hypothetical protein
MSSCTLALTGTQLGKYAKQKAFISFIALTKIFIINLALLDNNIYKKMTMKQLIRTL